MANEIKEQNTGSVQNINQSGPYNGSTTFCEMDKITIIMNEYNKLCKEIDTRTSNGYQLAAVLATVAVWAVSQQNFDMKFWLASITALIIFFTSGCFILININRAAIRLKQIEKYINERIGGEPLLIWETKYGRAETGYFKL